MKKSLAFILTIVLVFASVAFCAGAATSGNYTYTISGNSATITAFNKSATGAVSIPSTLGGKSVAKIAQSAFADCDGITSVTIPSSVVEIEESAFIFCSALAEIKLADNIQKIGVGAFYDTAYYNNSKNWQNGVLYIGKYFIAAKNRDTSSPVKGTCIIKNGTLTICDSAFSRCNELEGVYIPKSVRHINCDVFFSCTSMKTIYYAGTESQWSKIDIDDYNEEIDSYKIYYAGDIDFKNKTNSSDALTVLMASTGKMKLNDVQKAMADINGDNLINAGDALIVLQLSTGIVSAV